MKKKYTWEDYDPFHMTVEEYFEWARQVLDGLPPSEDEEERIKREEQERIQAEKIRKDYIILRWLLAFVCGFFAFILTMAFTPGMNAIRFIIILAVISVAFLPYGNINNGNGKKK